MSYYFEYLGTLSGKALLLVFDNKKYLFNCFEGFQRYSIESKSKISQLTTVILPTKESVVPFIGTYLTMGDMGVKGLNVITKHQNVMNFAQQFAHRPELHINYSLNYKDNKVEIKTFEDGNFLNVTLQIQPLRGKFNFQKAQNAGIPKDKWKILCNKGTIEHGGILYHGENFLDGDIIYEKIAVIFNTDTFDGFDMLSEVKIIICFSQAVAELLHKNLNARIYILDDVRYVDFRSHYKLQVELHNIYECFSLPVKVEISERTLNNEDVEYLNSCDTLTYCKRQSTYIKTRAEQLEFINHKLSKEMTDSVIFLGTGSAIPSKYRNVTSILLAYESKYIVLDCGEDTYYNIIRYFGNDSIIKDIDTIYISHSHADHHLGTVKLIQCILNYKKNVNLVCSENVADFISLFVETGIIFYDTRVKRYRPQFNEHLLDTEKYILKYDIWPKISICSVPHTSDSVGIRLDFENFSIAYSGDCRPSYLFTKMINGVDLLINEATFNDDLALNAHKTKHTTVEEAENVARQANVKTLLLTHFSQRYPKTSNSENNIGAFDFFCYSIQNFDPKKYKQCLVKIEELEKNKIQ